MKICVIGDIHGRTQWKEIINIEKPDTVVFLGDYFDSKESNLNTEDIIYNFTEIVEYKQNNPSCVLLLGNHDLHYSRYGSRCSGFDYHIKESLGSVLDDLIEEGVLQIAWTYNNIIFSHAGVTKTWLDLVATDSNDINNNIKHLNFNQVAGFDMYGDTISQSPVWVRPRSLLQDKLDGFTQVVGHTPQRTLKVQDNVWFCDTLPVEYLVIEDAKFTIQQL